MNFDFPDELKQLRDTARKFLVERCPSTLTRKALESTEKVDRALWREIGEMGWLSAAIPEAYGGLGLGHLSVCVLAEEMGRAIAPLPYSSSVYMAAEALLLYGSEQQKHSYLPRLATGQAVGTLAFVETAGPSNPASFDTRFVDGRLTGTKVVVPDGDIADFAIVAVRSLEEGPGLYIADLGDAGVTRLIRPTIDPSRGHATIRFDRAPAEPLPTAKGATAFQHLIDRAAVMMAFEQLGVAMAALEMACDYARGRYAFGRPIGSFQAIKHKLVDVYISTELARSNCYWGAWALESGSSELAVAAAASRIAACDAGWTATRENIQTHGGMGFTWEMDCHLFYRRARLQALALGSAREWKRRLVGALCARESVATPTDIAA